MVPVQHQGMGMQLLPQPLDFGDDVDAYALLGEDQDPLGASMLADVLQRTEEMQQQQQLQDAAVDAAGSSGALSGWFSGPACASPSSSPRQAAQSSRHKQAAGNAGKQGGSSASNKGRTSLAQREAHKRYREKKKQSIAAMEAAVLTKRHELEQLLAENEQLKSRARVLETAERCSVEIHELMKLLDGLQSLSPAELEDGAVDRGGGSCTSRPTASDASAPPADATPAEPAGAGRGSSIGHSSMGGSHWGPAQAAAAASAAGASDGASNFLQHLTHGSAGPQGALLAPPEAAGLVAVKQEPQDTLQAPASPAVRLSLQNEQHWLQMAQRYLEETPDGIQPPLQQPKVEQPQPQQQQQQQPGACAPGSNSACTPSAGAAAAAEGAAAAPAPSLSGCMEPSSTAESGSTVLAELGSVDTPEQGLVIYKAFLQKASEMLALVQQQQQQGEIAAAAATEAQLDDLTRTMIGRMQPFLVARGQGVVYDWNARNLDTQQPEEPPASLWPAVLDALQLAADTQRDALQCFELFGAPLARLLEERGQLAARYRQLQQAAPVGVSSSGSAAPGSDDVISVAAAKTLEAVAGPLITSEWVLQALAANLERYQSLDGVFAHSLTTLLTGAQIAAACVASYPYLPRWHAMMAALKQRKEEDVQQQQAALQGHHSSQMAQRRSTRVRIATQAARESYL